MVAQRSTFDTGNEDWGAVGDPASSVATWVPTGGNPGGHIRVLDAATGDIWYFLAPAKFRGNKCGAYGRHLRWEQYCSDTTQAHSPVGGRPDVVLMGGGLTLVYDLPYIPGTSWTGFEVLLREDAGWRLNQLNGPAPTRDEFQSVLTNVTALRIRGEYRTGPDWGGLDNVWLDIGFHLDLDADDSSGAAHDGFKADTLCGSPYAVPIVDADVLLLADEPLDSIVLRLLLDKDAGQEQLQVLGGWPSSISLVEREAGWLVWSNGGGAAVDDFAQALRRVRYWHQGNAPTPGDRWVSVLPYGRCGPLGVRYAYLHIARAGEAGYSGDTVLCSGSEPIDLLKVLGGSPTPGGKWIPDLPGGRFDPSRNSSGIYSYVAPAPATCAADTAVVEIAVEEPFSLGSDTILCYGDTWRLRAPDHLTRWQWSDGTQKPFLEIDRPGLYALHGYTAHCFFSDTVAVDYDNCHSCFFYAPNAFSPNDDGLNDTWRIDLSCVWEHFWLGVFDRWGNLVFQSNEPQLAWAGQWGHRAAPPGVYVWVAEWESDTPEGRRREQHSGDVLLVR